MLIRNMKITDVRPYERNPRRNTKAVDAVAASIKEFGWRAPIVVDTDMVIVCGHTRLKAAKKLGLKEVPVHIAEDLTPEDIDGRLSRLDMATQTVQNPREVWIQGKQKAYVQVFVKKNGGAKGCVVFAKDNNVVRSYYPRSVSSLDKARHGEQIK